MNIAHEIIAHDGLAATHELHAAGITRHMLRQALFDSEIVRVRQGWYALPDADPKSTQAARVGGRVSCVTAAKAHGLWAIDTPLLHVRVDPHSARLRSKVDKTKRLAPWDGVRVHWHQQPASGTRFVVDARTALRDMALCQPPERVVAAADSALRAGLLTVGQWRRDIAPLPRRLRRLLARVDGQSESIIESVMRFRLMALGYRPRVQVKILGVGRVDLVLGRRLVIELDGWEFHNSREAFETDRIRDARLARRGYLVLRFTWRQVTRQWAEVLGAIRHYLTLANSLAR